MFTRMVSKTAPNGLLAAHDLDTGQALYPVIDQVGSVRAWVDDTGNVQGRADYTTFGERTTEGVTLPFGFAGEYHDEPSGLLHLRARYYDPQVAIFTTVDPLVDATRDPYGYAAGDPTLFTDPSGEVAWLAPILGAAAVGAVAGGAISGVATLAAGKGWAAAGRAAAGGAVSGAVTGACTPFGALGMAACSSAGSIAGTATEGLLGADVGTADYVASAGLGLVGGGYSQTIYRFHRRAGAGRDVAAGWSSLHGREVLGGRITLRGPVADERGLQVYFGVTSLGGAWGTRMLSGC